MTPFFKGHGGSREQDFRLHRRNSMFHPQVAPLFRRPAALPAAGGMLPGGCEEMEPPYGPGAKDPWVGWLEVLAASIGGE